MINSCMFNSCINNFCMFKIVLPFVLCYVIFLCSFAIYVLLFLFYYETIYHWNHSWLINACTFKKTGDELTKFIFNSISRSKNIYKLRQISCLFLVNCEFLKKFLVALPPIPPLTATFTKHLAPFFGCADRIDQMHTKECRWPNFILKVIISGLFFLS